MSADWFHNIIVDGISRLYSLSLEGAPAADVLPITTSVWVATLWDAGAWDESLDSARMKAGFVRLERSLTRWPPPRKLLDELPPRPEQKALPAPDTKTPRNHPARARLAELAAWFKTEPVRRQQILEAERASRAQEQIDGGSNSLPG